MRQVYEYQQRAAEFRQMAARSSNDYCRGQLLHMADTWESLARDRAQQIESQKRIAALETYANGDASHL
jgi:hypothetical protein